jgi:hypothetical protein
LNAAFLIDNPTKEQIIRADPKSSEIIKPYLRGQDIERWSPHWAGLWMIFARRGIDIDAYPAVKQHLTAFRAQLESKPSDWRGGAWPGRRPGAYQWYELQDPVDYWREFEKPKIIYLEITWRAQWSLDLEATFSNNTVYFVPSDDLWILAVANSPITWWFAWRSAVHGKDEALRFIGEFVQDLPIPPPTAAQRAAAEAAVRQLIEIRKTQQAVRRDTLDWLRVEYAVDAPSTKLRDLLALDCDALIAEVKKVRGRMKPLGVGAIRNFREEYTRSIQPARKLRAEAECLEKTVSGLVNQAYRLRVEEVDLMWKTAPPRTPGFPPGRGTD